MKHFTVTFWPEKIKVSVHAGATILESAHLAQVILNSPCGGKGLCRKCIVRLEPEGREVLACQYRVERDLTVTVPAESRLSSGQILTEGPARRLEVVCDVFRDYVELSPSGRVLGLAIDVGTTTVVAKLLDMRTGQVLAADAEYNPQARYGYDVISRISHASTDQGLRDLQTLIIECINELIGRLCSRAAVNTAEIFEACVVGNTTMNHLLLGLSVKQLGVAPYEPLLLDARNVSPARLGLDINPAGNVHTVANIAGFVGADTTAVALATGIDLAEDVCLAVDIGTNGEVILVSRDGIYAASCAAGPALEGARITCGSRAVNGAIQAVLANEQDIDIDVIGGGPARSICGSGLIDAVAVLLELGVIEPTGRFNNPDEMKDDLPQAIRARLTRHNDQPAFRLSPPQPGPGGGVILTQQDIRELQLAKGAIAAGIGLLLQKLNLRPQEIGRIFLAGAFGNYIRCENAVRIGLLPGVAPDRIQFVGNAAATGAEMVLLSTKCRRKAAELARKIRYLEVAREGAFASVFADSMMLQPVGADHAGGRPAQRTCKKSRKKNSGLDRPAATWDNCKS